MKKILILSFAVVAFFALENFAQSVSGKIIVIDPGHGGNNAANDRRVEPDPGVVFWESESNFIKALYVDTLLGAKGADVRLTRYTNNYPNDADEPSLTARWTFANANNAHLFLSIHSNALGSNNTGTNYTLMLIKEDKATRQAVFPEALILANITGPEIFNANRTSRTTTYLDYTFYGGTSGGFNLGVLNGLNMPGQLSEGSFHDFYPETRRLMSNDYKKSEAIGIMRAFMKYYNHPFDTLGYLGGIVHDSSTNNPQNGAVVTLLPDNKTYKTDNFKNGYYMFYDVTPGEKTLVFSNSGYPNPNFPTMANKSVFSFFDLKPSLLTVSSLMTSSPKSGDTTWAVTRELGFRFSAKMDTNSVKKHFSISPEVPGNLFFTTAFETVRFYPTTPFKEGTWYTVTIKDSAVTLYGVPLDGNKDGMAGGNLVIQFRTAGAVSNDESSQPLSYGLEQNYPNPFNPSTKINFSLQNAELVTLAVYNITGELVRTVLSEQMEAGNHSVEFSAQDLPGGVYFYQLSAGSFRETKKMTLLK